MWLVNRSNLTQTGDDSTEQANGQARSLTRKSLLSPKLQNSLWTFYAGMLERKETMWRIDVP